MGAIEILLRRGVIRDTDEVLVEVFPDVSDAKAAELFTEINAAQPVRFVDMPGVVAPEMKWALEGAAGALKNKYPAMFSESARCKIPNVNLDALRSSCTRRRWRGGLACARKRLHGLDGRRERAPRRALGGSGCGSAPSAAAGAPDRRRRTSALAKAGNTGSSSACARRGWT